MTIEKHAILNAQGVPVFGSQDSHIVLANMLNKVIASRADYYNAGKYGDDSLMQGLRDDFTKWVVTSDRDIYSADSLEANIISYYGSAIIKPFERQCNVPTYNKGISLENALNTKEGLSYLQTIFNTKDDAKKITKTLIRLSGTDSNNISVWTSDSYRKRELEQVALLIYENPNFYIFECGPCSGGIAREVKLDKK